MFKLNDDVPWRAWPGPALRRGTAAAGWTEIIPKEPEIPSDSDVGALGHLKINLKAPGRHGGCHGMEIRVCSVVVP
jgi:hypothetical protein